MKTVDSKRVASLRRRLRASATGTAPRVAIIGCGFGGVAAAVYMVKAGFQDFVIYERTLGVGGVWHQNTYPGAEVDTPSDWYSYSFKQYDWPKPHSGQAILEKYLNDTIDEYGLREHIRLGTSVERAVWNERTQTYEVSISDGTIETFNVVVSAVGLFNVPNYPSWPGLDTFRGPAFHAANYEHEHDFAGKTVAVVGAGSSGTQIVPALAANVGQMLVFQRDPNWIAPKNDYLYTDEERAARRIPRVYQKARREHWRAETKLLWRGKVFREGTPENTKARLAMEAYIEKTLGDFPDIKKEVMPDHPFFAKRPVKADGFYEALRADNVTFRRAAVSEVTADGLVDSFGDHHPVDAIIMATGFKVAEFLAEIDVFGRDGVSLHEYWQEKGGPEAFLGLTVPGFPNFYMIYGPNTNMGQIVFNLETQARYLVRNLKRMRKEGLTSLDTRPLAHGQYNFWLQRSLAKTVWPEANNYLKDRSTGKLVVPFPRPTFYYWALTRVLRKPATTTRRVRNRPDGRRRPPSPASEVHAGAESVTHA